MILAQHFQDRIRSRRDDGFETDKPILARHHFFIP
jgi:hypothetical protein